MVSTRRNIQSNRKTLSHFPSSSQTFFTWYFKNFFIGVLGGGTLWHLQNFLQYVRYTWIHPL
jgi:hypothetical protein